MLQEIIKFLKPESGYSSKRLISVMAFIALVILSGFSVFGMNCLEIYVESLTIICLGGAVSTLLEKKKGENNDAV